MHCICVTVWLYLGCEWGKINRSCIFDLFFSLFNTGKKSEYYSCESATSNNNWNIVVTCISSQSSIERSRELYKLVYLIVSCVSLLKKAGGGIYSYTVE